MKQRILKELDVRASDPAASNYIDDIVAGSGKSTGEISALSRKLLFNVLNDYSAFSVSTIDHFFQRTLKAFSREIGQFASYQVELDKNSLVMESVDRILDALTEDNGALLSWLTESVSEQLLKNGKFSLDKELYETAIAMKSEEHRELVERYVIDEDKASLRDGRTAVQPLAMFSSWRSATPPKRSRPPWGMSMLMTSTANS